MKHQAMYHFSMAAMLLLACSFVNAPAVTNTSYGGAFIYFAGKYGGDITKKEMAGQTELKVEGCAKGARIINFTLVITKGGRTVSFTGKTNTLTVDMRNQLNALTAGDSFEFSHTKAYMPNGKDLVDVRGSKFVVV